MHVPKPEKWYRLGILTKDRPNGERTGRSPFGPQTATFRALSTLGARHRMRVFVFTPSGIDWKARRVRGLAWRRVGERTGWVRIRCPLPHVVYNRIPERAVEQKTAVTGLKARLQRGGIPLFNPSFLDKWEVGQLLQEDAELAEHTPVTWHYEAPESVLDALPEMGAVYLKPTGNSLGRGTVKLYTKPDGGYALQGITRHGTLQQKNYRTQHTLNRALARLVSRRNYIVQQAIPLSQWKGRPFDIRTLVQKTAEGSWQLTGAAGRLAARGHIVTHVPNGGTRRPLPLLLQQSLRLSPAGLNAKLEELEALAIRAAKAVELKERRPFGEFSMDIGIDRDGKLWIIEINGKPFQFDEKVIRRTARRNVVSYARYLAAEKSA